MATPTGPGATRARGPLVEALTTAVEAHDVVAAYLFGSHGRGTARPGSDVDVAVLFDTQPSPGRRLALQADLAAAVAPRRVDLVVLDYAPVALAIRALRDGVLLTGADDVRRVRHAADVMDRYLDMAPMRRTLAAGVSNRVREGRFGRR